MISCALAFVSGLGGVRQLFVFTLPAVIAALIAVFHDKNDRQAKALFYISFISFCFSAAGLLVNKYILPSIYSFLNYGENTYSRDLCYTNFSLGAAQFCINTVLELFGYKTGYIYSGYLVYNILCAIVCFFVMWALRFNLKNKTDCFGERMAALFFLSGLAVLTVIFCFIDIEQKARYFVPVIVFAVPLVFSAVQTHNFDVKPRIALEAKAGFLVLISVCCLNTYRQMFESEGNKEIKEIVSVIERDGLNEGYSSFWYGNIVTELSNGEIEMRLLGNNSITAPEDMKYVYEWLQTKTHVDTKPEGKCFLILSKEEKNECQFSITPAYNNARYFLYEFDSFDEFSALYS